jgi:hypothetical protein
MAPATADPKVLTRVKSIATKAINAAAQEHAKGLGGDANRSTATRAAYKIKADALDEIAGLVGSRPRPTPTGKPVATARPSRASAKRGVTPRPKGGAAKKSPGGRAGRARRA